MKLRATRRGGREVGGCAGFRGRVLSYLIFDVTDWTWRRRTATASEYVLALFSSPVEVYRGASP